MIRQRWCKEVFPRKRWHIKVLSWNNFLRNSRRRNVMLILSHYCKRVKAKRGQQHPSSSPSSRYSMPALFREGKFGPPRARFGRILRAGWEWALRNSRLSIFAELITTLLMKLIAILLGAPFDPPPFKDFAVIRHSCLVSRTPCVILAPLVSPSHRVIYRRYKYVIF